MIKLALVGKNIQHSKSPEIYRNILGVEIKYDLLDFSNPIDIPTANELLLKYDVVSITSPYKNHFIDECVLTEQAKRLAAINCLKKSEGSIIGENTDYIAICEIIMGWISLYGSLNIIILGNGVMANVTKVVLDKFTNVSYKVLSRKTSNHFDQLNIPEIFETQFSKNGQKIIINACARDYIFNGIIDKNTIFWDYNYNFKQHFLLLSSQTREYVDGTKMLELQARHALAFWSIKSI